MTRPRIPARLLQNIMLPTPPLLRARYTASPSENDASRGGCPFVLRGFCLPRRNGRERSSPTRLAPVHASSCSAPPTWKGQPFVEHRITHRGCICSQEKLVIELRSERKLSLNTHEQSRKPEVTEGAADML